MGYDSYTNYPQSFVGNRAPGLNFTKVNTTTVDTNEVWPSTELLAQNLNLFDDRSQDTILSQYANAARRVIEEYLNRNLGTGTKTCDVYYPSTVFSQAYVQPVGYLDLPTEAASDLSIVSLSYYNNATPIVKTTIPTTNYFLDNTGQATRVIVTSPPTDVSTIIAAPIMLTISYGQSNTIATDPSVIQAGLLLASHFYNNRDAYTDVNLKSIPVGVTTLLASYKDIIL